jgi:hypothetical protein
MSEEKHASRQSANGVGSFQHADYPRCLECVEQMVFLAQHENSACVKKDSTMHSSAPFAASPP